MVDQTQTDKTIQAVADTAKATAATVEAVTQAAAPQPAATRAPRAVRATRKTTAKARSNAKPATPARRGRKPNDTAAKPAKPATARATKTARRAPQAAAAVAAPTIERTATLTKDFSQMFAGFQLPGADKFQGLFTDAGARSQDLAVKGQEMTDIAKANVEAIAEAGRIAAAGVKSIGQDVVVSSRSGFEQASEAVRTLSDAKSPTEFFQLQSELVRSSFDRMVAETSKLTEQMVKLAGEAIQPISNRASVNAERVNELMA
jgi:phasin family protein